MCVSAPGKPYVSPTVSLVAPIIATTPAPVLTDVADAVNPKCGRYYHVNKGDYCNMIVIKFKISLEDFVFLNPSINANYTNLLADESYCVQAVGDSKLPTIPYFLILVLTRAVNTYSGRAGYSTPAATQGPVTGKYNDLPDVTYVSPTATATSVLLADGIRVDYNNYFNGDIF